MRADEIFFDIFITLHKHFVYGYSGRSRPSDKGGGGGHPDSEVRGGGGGGGSQKKFSALRASGWYKNKGESVPGAASLDPPLGERHKVMTSAQNGPKTATSS